MRRRVIFFLGVCLFFVGCGEQSKEVTADLLSWKEAKALVKGHQGKVVVMDVWSTSCPPCMQEFPGLVDLHQKYKADVRCISICLDFKGFTDKPSDEVQQRALAFLTKRKATFQNVICTDPDSDVYETAEFNSLPAVYVFDREGNLEKLFSHALEEFGDNGFTYAEHITPLVQKMLAEK